jgi:serine/threonine protein kinase
LGEVAIKVLKYHERANWGKQHAFAMHRECQWSVQHLHNTEDPHYCPKAASIFARYLEDNTGFPKHDLIDFAERRAHFEAPDLDWEREVPPLPSAPYVVMELCAGEPLHCAIDRDRRRSHHSSDNADSLVLSAADKHEVLLQAASALNYLSRFGLIHRDFRGCNIHISRSATGSIALKVLDLGVMVVAEDGQQWNNNPAVQAFRRRGETEEKRKRYDWLPWEVRAGADGSGPAVNFSLPQHSFDIFSLGVLALHLLLGRSAGRLALETVRLSGRIADTAPLGLDPQLLRRMLGDACGRPHPTAVVQALQQGQLPQESQTALAPAQWIDQAASQKKTAKAAKARKASKAPRPSRSRSRKRRRHKGSHSLSDSNSRGKAMSMSEPQPEPQPLLLVQQA